MDKSEVKVGMNVVFIDSVRRRVKSLVQAVHSTGGCVNLVQLSSDENKTDQYGRQVEHVTSCNHCSDQNPTVGYCWHFPDEVIEIDESNIQTQK